MLIQKTLKERFWENTDIKGPDDCWIFKLQKDKKGYGLIKVHGHQMIASRVAYELTYGSIPPGMFVCHRCDNPPCVNPAHLFLGTSLDNVRDMIAKGRANHPKGRKGYDEHGENNPRAKLTWEQVREIRKSYIPRIVTQRQLAEKYGVSKRAILFILRNETWIE